MDLSNLCQQTGTGVRAFRGLHQGRAGHCKAKQPQRLPCSASAMQIRELVSETGGGQGMSAFKTWLCRASTIAQPLCQQHTIPHCVAMTSGCLSRQQQGRST